MAELELLIAPGVDVLSRKNQTPLMSAAEVGNVAMVRRLLELGADPRRRCKGGSAAVHYAGFEDGECVEVLKALLEADPGLDMGSRASIWLWDCVETGAPFDLAAIRNFPKTLEFLIERGYNEMYERYYNVRDTVLHVAIDSACYQRDYGDIVGTLDVLFRHGADPNWKNADGHTPLHLLDKLYRDHIAPVGAALIAAGADVHSRDNDGRTPLLKQCCDCYFIEYGVRFLLEAGADAAAVDRHRNNAFHLIALTAAHMALFEPKGYETPPDMSFTDKIAAMKMLVDAGGKPTRRNRAGLAPLQALKEKCGENWERVGWTVSPFIVAQLKAGDLAWDSVPPGCKGLSDALLSVWERRSPDDMAYFFQRLTPKMQEQARAALRALHRPLQKAPEELRIRILQEALED